MNEHHFSRRNWNCPRSARGFTITELLVVIGIIILLAGILLVALGRVRDTALRTTTTGTMQAFAQAVDSFQTEHQRYPGVIPERILARAIAVGSITVSEGEGEPSLTGTENALLHLMGGYRVLSPSDDPNGPTADDYDEFDIGPFGFELTINPGNGGGVWRLKINPNQIGEGPIIDRQQFSPYFTPGSGMIGNVEGQAVIGDPPDDDDGLPNVVSLPDLVDAWGQPILYFRQLRTSGPLVAPASETDERPQYYLESALPYLNSVSLGERSESQVFSSSNPRGSVLSDNLPQGDRYANFAQLLRHPSFGTWNDGPMEGTNLRQARPRGAYSMFSAGPDGIFFSAADGPGQLSAGGQVTDLTAPDYSNPQSIEEYNDIRIFGGG